MSFFGVIPAPLRNGMRTIAARQSKRPSLYSRPCRSGEVFTGWTFASGDAKSPSEQYCYYLQKAGEGTDTRQHIARNGAISFAAPVAPAEQAARFQKCQWWKIGSL